MLEAQVRAQKQKAVGTPREIAGERQDYVRALQVIALGYEPEARISDRLAALKLLTELGAKGVTSHFEPRSLETLYGDDPEFIATVATLNAALKQARKQGHLQSLRDEVLLAGPG